MNLDNFRVVNDSMGSQSGDAVLFAFAERIREQPRPQDTVARFGEDEFAVVLEELEDLGGAVRVAERISRALARHERYPVRALGRSVIACGVEQSGGFEGAEWVNGVPLASTARSCTSCAPPTGCPSPTSATPPRWRRCA